ncbi:hypothetical protein [Hymenobacter actinosclerus]|uniref:hypothetical protein n=1 Tax=Hymenobacter actinosclerus TaxID=82805 RepID=UPI0015A53A80|nr:hypothetical protein [Hymenobacter actinosclerus]
MMVVSIPEVQVNFRRYLALSLRYTFRRKPLTTILLVPWLLSVWLAGTLFTGPVTVLDFLQKEPLGTLFILFFLLLPLLTVWGTRRQYQASSLLQHAADYILSATGVGIRGPVVNADLAWPAFTRADRFGSWLLLQTSEQSAFFLDLEQVAAPANSADALAMIQASGVSIHS